MGLVDSSATDGDDHNSGIDEAFSSSLDLYTEGHNSWSLSEHGRHARTCRNLDRTKLRSLSLFGGTLCSASRKS